MTKLSARPFSAKYAEPSAALVLICSTNTLVELRAAVDNGADWVKLNIQAATIGGFSLDNSGIRKGIRYAHDRQCRVLLSLPNSELQSDWRTRREIVNSAARLGVDALVCSDPALMLYAATHFPQLQLYCALENAALNREAIDFYQRKLGVTGLLLPRVVSLSHLAQLADTSGLCVVVYGFSTLTTTASRRNEPDMRHGRAHSASGASHPRLAALAHTVTASDMLGPCAGDESSANDCQYRDEETFDLNVLRFLPALNKSGVRAVVAEAPPHAPMHLGQVTRIWREAINDCLENIEHYSVKQTWLATLNEQSKGISCEQSGHLS
jgi:collagenase-like PrtC family protease